MDYKLFLVLESGRVLYVSDDCVDHDIASAFALYFREPIIYKSQTTYFDGRVTEKVLGKFIATEYDFVRFI